MIVLLKKFPLLCFFSKLFLDSFIILKFNLINYSFNSREFSSFVKSLNKDKFLIFGSGESINNISKGEFTSIKNNCITIGIGRWIYHDFVPDIYLFETDSIDSKIFEFTKDFITLVNQRVNDYKKTLILVDNAYDKPIVRKYILKNIDPKLSINIRFVKPFCPASGNVKFFIASLNFLKLLKFFNLSLHCRSTTIHAICFGLIFGFKDIILAGVDGYTGYFSDNPNFHKDFGNLDKSYNYDLHCTSNPKYGLPTVPDCIFALNNMYCNISVLDKNTVLYPEIGIFSID